MLQMPGSVLQRANHSEWYYLYLNHIIMQKFWKTVRIPFKKQIPLDYEICHGDLDLKSCLLCYSKQMFRFCNSHHDLVSKFKEGQNIKFNPIYHTQMYNKQFKAIVPEKSGRANVAGRMGGKAKMGGCSERNPFQTLLIRKSSSHQRSRLTHGPLFQPD